MDMDVGFLKSSAFGQLALAAAKITKSRLGGFLHHFANCPVNVTSPFRVTCCFDVEYVAAAGV